MGGRQLLSDRSEALFKGWCGGQATGRMCELAGACVQEVLRNNCAGSDFPQTFSDRFQTPGELLM
ncbi:hypothetical protein D7319_32245 [Streptomyces radicis]|uniref:Uncharacterized protein n=1 Tax=Streptomyces radicis TaxID=1750517 RepID=A0A3A9VRC6_9ACTN|nr:hypothetical protein D7319_32245 [Streptomyces radicis]RKN13027.1 hypothetical protein D7318_32120 [Streptomyces radicis]